MMPGKADPAEFRYLIAGAGDLGLRAARLLGAGGAEVHALRRHPPRTAAARDAAAGPGHGQPPGPEPRWIAADLTRPDSLDGLPEGITHVLYAVAPAQADEAGYRAAFLDGPAHLLARLDASALRRFVFVSSSAVYGASEDWVDEDTPPAPAGYNGRILLQAERALQAALPGRAVALRCSGLYGPGRTRLLDRLRQGAVKVPDEPSPWINRIHIEDAARAAAHLLALEAPQDCYLGTDGRPHRQGAFYDALARMAGAPAVPRSGPAGDAGRRLSNARLLASGFTLRWPDALEAYAALCQAPD